MQTFTNKLIRNLFKLESLIPSLKFIREWIHAYGPARFAKGDKVWHPQFTPGEIVSVHKKEGDKKYIIKDLMMAERFYVVSDRDLFLFSDSEIPDETENQEPKTGS